MSRALGPALILLWLAAKAAHVPPLVAVSGMAIVSLLPGLALLRVLGFGSRPAAWRLVGAGTLSPPLVAAVALPAGLLGFPLERVAWPLVLISIVVLAAPSRAAAAPAGPRSGRGEAAWPLAGLALAGCVAPAAFHARLLMWSDSWFHAAVFNEVLRAGVPPGFPPFAGMTLPYPWFFHVFLAAIRRIVSEDPFVLTALVNQWTAFLLPSAFWTLARALGLSPRASAWSAAAGLLGVDPLGPLLLAARALVGETVGGVVLRAALSGPEAVQDALAWHFPGFQTSWLARLWTPSAFNFAIVLGAFVLALVVEQVRTPSARVLALFTAGFTLLLHWHTLTGLDLAFGIAAGVACATLARLRVDARRALAEALALAGALAVAYALSRPYLRLVIVGGATSVARPGFSVPNAFGLVLAMGPVALAALASLPALPSRARPWAIGCTAGLGLMLLVCDLPVLSEEKFWWPLFVPVAAVSGAAIERLARGGMGARAALATALALSCANLAITAAGFLGDRATPRSMFDPVHPDAATFYTRDEIAALDWVRTRSPADAVFLQPMRPLGTEPILVSGGRRLYLGSAEVFYRAAFHETAGRPPIPAAVWSELERRDALQRDAFSHRPLGRARIDSLRGAPWPVFVWWDSLLARGALSPTLADTLHVTRVAFESPSLRILALR